MWNASILQHIGSHSFGINRGSLTWVDQHPATGIWYGTFANYDRVQPGQTQPYGLTMNTQSVRFSGPPSWDVVRPWISPMEQYQTFSPMSNSGSSFGPDGWLYITEHDAIAAYVMKIPAARSILIWVATVSLPEIAGQGIAWDRSDGRKGSLSGISREAAQVVEMRVPLQDCGWMTVQPVVGELLLPGSFIDPESN